MEPTVLVNALCDEFVRELGVLDVRLVAGDGSETVCSGGDESSTGRVCERLVLREVDVVEDCAVRGLTIR